MNKILLLSIVLVLLGYSANAQAKKIELEYLDTGLDAYRAPCNFFGFEGDLYFCHHDQLVVMDIVSKQVKKYSFSWPLTEMKYFASLDNTVYFSASNSTSPVGKLYSIKKSQAPTLVPACDSLDSVAYVTVYNEKVFFTASSPSAPVDLWCYDRATQTVTTIKNPSAVTPLSRPKNLIVANSKLYIAEYGGANHKLWVYNDQNGLLSMVNNFPAGYTFAESISNTIKTMTVYNDELYIVLLDNVNGFSGAVKVSKTTGSVETIPPPTPYYILNSYLTPLDGKLYSCNGHIGNSRIGWYDATNNTSDTLKCVPPAAPSINPLNPARVQRLVGYNHDLFFFVNASTKGQIFFSYDPQTNTCSQITDTLQNPFILTEKKVYSYAYGNKLYFTATSDSIPGYHVWSYYDPTVNVESMPEPKTAKVYPNPFSSAVIIELPDNTAPFNLKVYDVAGRLLVNKALNNATRFEMDDLAAYPSGIYTYRLYGRDVNITGKLTKQ